MQVSLINRMMKLLPDDADLSLSVGERAEMMLALLQKSDPMLALKKTAKEVIRPET